MRLEDLQSSSVQFTRFDGYQHRYDQPEKYFWQDMDQAISNSLSSLNNFDRFYLTDVLDEAIGSRKEG